MTDRENRQEDFARYLCDFAAKPVVLAPIACWPNYGGNGKRPLLIFCFDKTEISEKAAWAIVATNLSCIAAQCKNAALVVRGASVTEDEIFIRVGVHEPNLEWAHYPNFSAHDSGPPFEWFQIFWPSSGSRFFYPDEARDAYFKAVATELSSIIHASPDFETAAQFVNASGEKKND